MIEQEERDMRRRLWSRLQLFRQNITVEINLKSKKRSAPLRVPRVWYISRDLLDQIKANKLMFNDGSIALVRRDDFMAVHIFGIPVIECCNILNHMEIA